MDALLAGMTSAQLAGWAAFAALEPFGPLREDMRAATAACAVANSIPRFARGGRAMTPGDLFGSLAGPDRLTTPAAMAEHAMSTTLAMGGEVKTIPRGDASDVRKARRPGDRNRRQPRRAG